MATENNESSWFKNIASVFVKFDDNQPETNTTAVEAIHTISAVATGGMSNDFVSDLRKRFKKVLDDKNQEGFDFYEFSMMLLRSSQNPTLEHFKTAFEGAKIMNPSCNQAFLLHSANFYKAELQTAFASTLQAGEQKKTALNTDKTTEQKQLSADIQDMGQQLAQLHQQIAAIEKEKQNKESALQGIDARFSEKIMEIEQKITATVQAKESVLSEITLIENGIKQHLS